MIVTSKRNNNNIITNLGDFLPVSSQQATRPLVMSHLIYNKQIKYLMSIRYTTTMFDCISLPYYVHININKIITTTLVINNMVYLFTTVT